MENKEELNQAKESELESANGGLDLFGALFSLKNYEKYVCPRPHCRGRLIYDKNAAGLCSMKCVTCGWHADYKEGENTKKSGKTEESHGIQGRKKVISFCG